MGITTLNGEDVEVYKEYKNSDPVINSSNVVVPNVLATNGVIHAIDAVLVPPSVDVTAFLADCPGTEKICGKEHKKPTLNIPETAVSLGFETLVAALISADLLGTLSGTGPFTVFAPTNDAFAALPDGLVTCLLLPESLGALTSILKYHVVQGEAYSCNLKNEQMITTMNGEDVEVYKEYKNSDPVINSSNVVVPNVLATNGVIHAIDAVLVPPSVDVGAFLAACPGTEKICGKEHKKPTLNIPETAVSLGFETLVAALISADLLGTLSGTGPFAVFAPTNDAFAALPDGLVTCLLLPQSLGALTSI